MKIVLCSNAAFYEHVNQIADQLEKAGHEAVVPDSAQKMRDSGDYDVVKNKTWYQNKADFHKKRALMDGHFAEVVAGDAVLLVNDEKHGVPGYIGPNALMEMAIAYYHKKPIYVLNNVAEDNPVYEEIMGMECVQLGGNIDKI